MKMAKMKRCTKCKKLKDEGEFSKHPSHKDGLRCWCKKCECDYIHEYYSRHRRGVKKHRSYGESHRVVRGVRQKQCNKCKRWKPEEEFYKRRESKDGLDLYCKKCTIETARKSRERRLAVRN